MGARSFIAGVSLVLLMIGAGCGGDDASSEPPPPAPAPNNGGGTGNGTASPDGPTNPGGPLNPDTPLPAFKKGDAFDAAKVGARSQMVQAMLEGLDYANSTAPKAIALNKVGLGFVSVKPGATQEDAERTAKEACVVIGGGGRCHLIASGNTFVADDTIVQNDAEGFILVNPTSINAIPFATTARATEVITRYTAVGNKPRAIAIGLDGTVTFAPTTSTALAAANNDDASRVALERCEMMAGFSPCTLYAVGANIVLDATKPNWTPAIDYGRTTVATNIPGSVAAAFTSYIGPEYVTAVRGGKSGAIYVSRDGAGGYYYGSGSVATQAKANCDAKVTTGEPCIPYATNLNVVLKPTDLYALVKGNTKLHCLAMPRTSCAAHKAMGCAPGSYYTAVWGVPALENCQ